MLLAWIGAGVCIAPTAIADGVDFIYARVNFVASPDSDGDGLVDATEEWMGTDEADPDSDDDGLLDGDEVFVYATNPLDPDTDSDRLPDGWEVAVTLDPTNGTGDDGAEGDPDLDGFRNLGEYVADTDPFDEESLLALIELDTNAEGATVTWIGGVDATQFLERVQGLTPTGTLWQSLLTNIPPTAVTNTILDSAPASPDRMYRIKATR